MAEADKTEDEGKLEEWQIKYQEVLGKWSQIELWPQPDGASEGEKASEEKVKFIGARLPSDLVEVMDDHAALCGVTRTTYIRNALITAMMAWSKEGQGLVEYFKLLAANPAAKAVLESFIRFVQSLQGPFRSELSQLGLNVYSQIIAADAGIPVEKVLSAVSGAVADAKLERLGEKKLPSFSLKQFLRSKKSSLPENEVSEASDNCPEGGGKIGDI